MRETENEIEYIIVDFKGYIRWRKVGDRVYLVDPSWLDYFLKAFKLN